MKEQGEANALVLQLSALPQLRDLPASDLAELVEHTDVLYFGIGAEIFRQGQPGLTALLLLTGRLEATVLSGDLAVLVGSCHPGEIVGESALLGREPVRNATVRAVEESSGLLLTPGLLDLRQNKAVVLLEQNLVSTLARRVRRSNLAIKQAWRQDPDPTPTEAPTLRQRLQGILRELA